MKKIYALVTTLVILGSVTAFAASTQDVDIDVAIPTLLTLDWSISGSSIQLTGANKITEAEYIAGYKDNIFGGRLVVYANTAWDMTVVASGDNFSGGSGVKPTSDLMIDLDNATTYSFPLNGVTPVLLYSNYPATQAEEHDVNYKSRFRVLSG